ncbi:MAG: methyltransferase domain-containing protein [Nitrospinae bacterium]|nr:methyltransferase domain-containing protein [Nitrospinota bacterium]
MSEAQWKEFSDNHFKKWSPLPLSDDNFFKDKVCLDAGCGSGRAVRSLLLAGAKKVCGVDMGVGCVRNTTGRNKDFADRIEIKHASVLEIPYPDATFDFVHCDGVLHHTTNPEQGFKELVRVLKPGGDIVMAVYGRGGLMNFAIYASRIFKDIIPMGLTFKILKALSDNPVTWYAVLDCMYVPIRENYYAWEIKKWFEQAGLSDITRMDSTWGPYAYGPWMKGEGYVKFLAKKPLE